MTESLVRQALTINQLQQATGLSISTLRRRVKDGSLPVIQAGGRGKKLLFPVTVLEELCLRGGVQSNASMQPTRSTSDDAGRGRRYSAAEQFRAEHTDGQIEGAFAGGSITRPESGPIPNWMRSPLLSKFNSNTDKARNEPCQNDEKTN